MLLGISLLSSATEPKIIVGILYTIPSLSKRYKKQNTILVVLQTRILFRIVLFLWSREVLSERRFN